MKEITKSIPAITHEQIALRAQSLWQRAGHPMGRDLEFWLEAERSLRSEFEQQTAAAAARTETASVTRRPVRRPARR